MDDFLGYTTEEWYPMSPVKGPPLPSWMEIYWPWCKPSAEGFVVSDLFIYPQEANPGMVVTISCLVKNAGKAGSHTVILGGDFVAEQTVSLQPGESKTVSFDVTPTEIKTYHVSVDGLTGSFSVIETPVADIRLENLVISPSEVYVGETVTISVTATNYGSVAGTRVVECNVT